MSDPETAEHPSGAETREILNELFADIRQGRVLWDGGPAWERVRIVAFKNLIVRPLSKLLQRCKRRLEPLLRRVRGPRARVIQAP